LTEIVHRVSMHLTGFGRDSRLTQRITLIMPKGITKDILVSTILKIEWRL